MTRAPAADVLDRLPGALEDDEDPTRVTLSRRQALAFGLFVLASLAFLYFGLPQIAGLGDTWDRLNDGDPWWLAGCVAFKLVSYAGYMWLFKTVFVREPSRIGWRESYLITMAGVAATRLFAAAGAGGIVLTAWALRRAGMEPRTLACRMVAFHVLLYTVYALAMVVGGFGLYLGVLNGGGSFAITMVPAIVGAVAFVIVYTTAFLPEDVERRLADWSERGSGRVRSVLAKLAAAPASVAEGVRASVRMVRDREWGVLGGVIWWGFDIATLWAALHAFGGGGETPPIGVIVVAYFVGMMGNLLPLPGGIGGVDGGMIGAFVAFGVPFGYATVAVLAFRAFAFWLPTIPGAIAYLQLRRTISGWRAERPAELGAGTAPA